MRPKKQERSAIDDLFRMRLEQILDQRHVLYRLAGKIDWALVEERFGGLYAESERSGGHYRRCMFPSNLWKQLNGKSGEHYPSRKMLNQASCVVTRAPNSSQHASGQCYNGRDCHHHDVM
jgi:hypothetical protein